MEIISRWLDFAKGAPAHRPSFKDGPRDGSREVMTLSLADVGEALRQADGSAVLPSPGAVWVVAVTTINSPRRLMRGREQLQLDFSAFPIPIVQIFFRISSLRATVLNRRSFFCIELINFAREVSGRGEKRITLPRCHALDGLPSVAWVVTASGVVLDEFLDAPVQTSAT